MDDRFNPSKGTHASPPADEAELLKRTRQIAGRTLEMLAQSQGIEVPPDQRRAKGWTGQLLEAVLGATAKSKAEMDFEALNIELKTLPIDARGLPTESTYVCVVPLTDLEHLSWQSSWVRKKLSRVLWIPVEASKEIPLSQRRVGTALLWSPDPDHEDALRADWTELTDMIRLGEVESITAHMGDVLQIRPKAADARARREGVDEHGHRMATLPRGFYLRTRFTREILGRYYASGDGR